MSDMRTPFCAFRFWNVIDVNDVGLLLQRPPAAGQLFYDSHQLASLGDVLEVRASVLALDWARETASKHARSCPKFGMSMVVVSTKHTKAQHLPHLKGLGAGGTGLLVTMRSS